MPVDQVQAKYTNPENKLMFDFPKFDKEGFKRHQGGDVYRVAKNSDHDEQVRRSKSFLPEVHTPFDLKDMNLVDISK